MSNGLRGYDIDGVLVPGKVAPVHPYIVISGRLVHEFPRTVREIGGEVAIYLRPFGCDGDHTEAARWKSLVINLAGVTEFYEDTPAQAAIIRACCPHCIVHLVT